MYEMMRFALIYSLFSSILGQVFFQLSECHMEHMEGSTLCKCVSISSREMVLSCKYINSTLI